MFPLKPALLALAWVAIAPAFALAQADISGVWEVTVEAPQGAATIDATFKQDGEAVTGEVASPMGTAEFTGKLVKDALTITYAVPVQGNVLEIAMAGTVAGDTMTGTISFGGLGEATWSAKRKPAGAPATAFALPGAPDAAAPPDPATAPAPAVVAVGGVAGKWNVALQTPQGEMPVSAALVQDGEQVTGTLSSPIGEVPVSGTFKDSLLNLEFVVASPNGDIKVTMSGTLAAGGLAGTASFGGVAESEWTATRIE